MIRIVIEINETVAGDTFTVGVSAKARHIGKASPREMDMQAMLIGAILEGARGHYADSGADEYRERIDLKGGES